jgi:hypothetical protein
MTLCAFGCGSKAKFIQKNGKEICEVKASKCPALRAKNISNTGRRFSAEHKEKLSKSNKETKSKQTIVAWNKGITKEIHSGMMAVSEAQKRIAIEQITKIISSTDPIYNNFRKYRSRIVTRSNYNYKLNKQLLNPENKKIGRFGDNVYHLDHLYPVAEGFRYSVPIELMSAVENLQILPYKENISKSNKLINDTPVSIKQYLKEQQIGK